MGQVANQLLVGLGLIQQAFLPILLGLRLERQHFNDEFAGPVGLGQDHVDRHRLALVLAQQPGVVTQRRELVAGGSLQRVLQQLRLREALRKTGALDGAARAAEGVFQRRIGEQHRAIAGNHGHQRGQQVQRLEADGGDGGSSPHFDAVTRASSRLMPAMSFSLRAMLAFSSATRSRYF